jgi:nucleoside-diphosphate-sugar epimerase
VYSNNTFYIEDIINAANCPLDWKIFKNKNILVTGACGLIGTFLIDVLMYRNLKYNDNITVYALGRNKGKVKERFGDYINLTNFCFVEHDVQMPLENGFEADFIIHGAGNTHPIAYATDPINTLMVSILGTKNILDFALKKETKRVLFLSTVEIYGENRGDVECFAEDYCGYIDSNTLRAGYTEGKRAAEALCQAYIAKEKLDIVIARCCRVYGPTMGNDDSKVIAQFIRNAVNKENIVLKSKGDQLYSYSYVADICSALLVILINGKNGEAYNISDNDCNLSLLEIANVLSEYTDREIVFDIPSSVESAGYSKATRALLDSSKLRTLGWKPIFPLKDGIIRTIEILRHAKQN